MDVYKLSNRDIIVYATAIDPIGEEDMIFGQAHKSLFTADYIHKYSRKPKRQLGTNYSLRIASSFMERQTI